MIALTTAIVGGGVSGLAVARGLLRRFELPDRPRHRLQLYERHDHGQSQGFGFLVQADGCRALRRLGIDPVAPGIGLCLRHVQILLSDGSVVGEHQLENTVAMERPALLQALSQGMDPAVLRFGEGVEGFVMQGSRVSGLKLPGGRIAPVDLVIAADGAHSRCRALIDSGPRLSGQLARVHEIVACVQHPGMAKRLGSGFIKVMPPQGGLAVGLVPLPAGRVIWFLQFDSDRYRFPDRADLRAFALQLLEDFPSWLLDFLRESDPALLHHWRPLDLDPPTRLVGPNLALIGDAAHPMLPFTSQGVNLALADAELLTALLTSPGQRRGLSELLRIYDSQRQPLRPPLVAMGRAMTSDFLASAERAANRPPVAT
jgi:salicylate hydroxylase